LLKQAEPDAQEHDNELNRCDRGRDDPEQAQIFFEDVPDHNRQPPSRAAFASVVKMVRSAIGCASICLIPLKRAAAISARRASSNCVSTKLNTLPATAICIQPAGAGRGIAGSVSKVMRTSRTRSDNSVIDSWNSS